MRLDAELVKSLDLKGALAAAEKRPGDFFPSRLGYAAAMRSEPFVSRLAASLRADYAPSAAEVVQVPKWSGGTRPAQDLSVADRVLLDSLIARVRTLVVPGLVNWSPRGEDRRKAQETIAAKDAAYVLMTDVASFYEYVDHDILADELLDLTGDESGVSALSGLLEELMRSRRGLPQGPLSVGDLADIYLSAVDRRMVRDDFELFRFTDDYRLPVQSWESARVAQIRLERYLRDVGLVINVGKTISPRHELYVQWEEESRAAWLDEMITGAVVAEGDDEEEERDPDEALFASEYDSVEWELPDGIDQPRLLERIETDLRLELDRASFWGTPDNVRQSKRIRPALAVLASLGSTSMLQSLPVLLRNYPHLTVELSLALRDLVSREDRAEAVLDSLSGVLSNESLLFDWQTGWLLHAMVPAVAWLPPALVEFTLEQFHRESAPWFVRARAAAVLGTEGKLPLGDDLRHLIDNCPAASLPDLIGAAHRMPAGQGDQVVRSAKDPISRAVPEFLDDMGNEWL